MPASVVGRDAELAVIEDFLAGIAEGAAVLALEGEAGMGKTTLWRAAIDLAASAGVCVLRSEPAESETALSFSAIGDLLDSVLDRALSAVSAGQRRALSRALILEEEEGPAPDAHAVGVALLNALRELAHDDPLLVAVDDAQWLDPASAGALTYAARRLRAERIGLLVSRRSGLESGLFDELRRAFSAERFTLAEVGPLDPAALHSVVQEHLGVGLPRPLLTEVHQASGGNPFYALEIVRALKRGNATVEAGQPLAVPRSLHELVRGRLLALPAESRDFLLAAAAHAHPTVAITEEVSGISREVGLAPALEAGLVELAGARIRFTHPLLAAGVYDLATPLRRGEVHAGLAQALVDPEAKAWQLAACVEEPGEGVAAALESAAEVARARGAPRPAALLLDRACELTPPDRVGDALRRAVDAAFLHFESGDALRAERQLQSLIATLPAGLQRARAIWVLARIRTYEAPAEAAELFLHVAEQAAGDPELIAAAHEGVASSLYYALERLGESAEHAETALDLARDLGDKALEGDILISKLGAEALIGDPAAGVTAALAQELQRDAANRRILDQPLLAVAEWWSLCDRHQEARDTLLELLRQVDEIGDESARPYLLFLLGRAESAMGNLRGGLDLTRDGSAAAEQSGQPLFAAYNLAAGAIILAELGDEARARRSAAAVLEATRAQSRLAVLLASSATGHLELSLAAGDAVVASLEPMFEFVRREGIAEPAAMRFVVDFVEALVELGRGGEAREALDWYEAHARRLGRVSAVANCLRCRGLLGAQAGDLDAALAAFSEALTWHAEVELPLDRGRTLLALGATQRRMKRRREARATLDEAVAVFERIGAALWAERARAELKRISGRASTRGALTPAEERVAALVVEGKTNKQVAAALFLSDRTVEGHLARIFGKLGIGHRAELAGALQTRGIVVPNAGDSPVSAGPLAP